MPHKITLLILLLYFLPFAVLAKGQHRIDTTPNLLDEGGWTLTVEQDYYHIPNQVSQTTGNALPTDTYYLNATLDYSLPNGLDIQLQTQNCPLAGGGAQNYECDSYINLSQTFDITDDWSAIVGTQNGTVFKGPLAWHNADYALAIYQPIDDINLHGGTYFVDKDLSVTTNTVGYTLGFALGYNKWRVEADYFSGHNNLSGAQVNTFYGPYYLGVIVPEHNSGNEFAGVCGVRWAFGK